MSNLPSIKTLSRVFGDDAKEARRILEMSREELEEHPVGKRRCDECYNPPWTGDLRMTILDDLAKTHGVEGFQNDDDEWVSYLNTGDSYAATVLNINEGHYTEGRYVVSSWGDYVEKHCKKER